jgi:hypothetical protein
MTSCKIEECLRPLKAREMCGTHYHAWWVRQPRVPNPISTGRPRNDIITYRSMHKRVMYERGRASVHQCITCGNQAEDWTWNTTCEDFLLGVGAKNRPNLNKYCMHIEHYDPRCTACHMIFDKVSISSQLVIQAYPNLGPSFEES